MSIGVYITYAVPALFILYILYWVCKCLCECLCLFVRNRLQARKLANLASVLSDNPIVIDEEIPDTNNNQEVKTNAQVRFVKPDYWSNNVPDDQVLVEITPCDDEYWMVDAKLKHDMPDAHISLLFRVQNPLMWSYYCFHKDRLSMCNIDHNEKDVWHGTSLIDPSLIYNNPLDGFMMQFAREGLWGRGIYFAENSSNSDTYAFKSLHKRSSVTDRSPSLSDEREMFLTKVLVGKSVELRNEDMTLVVPPKTGQGEQRYNTVIGSSAGSPIYVVYENGRAYPSYLVRYYKGCKDTQRTPYMNIEEALAAKQQPAQGRFVKPDYWSNNVPDDQVLVEITPFDDEYWIVDRKLKHDMRNAHLSSLFRVQNPLMWSYYCFHKEHLSMCSIDHNEKDVWHGTRLINPSVIYNNPLDGFMMQFAREGSWGRGIYFAEKSSYSHSYAYKSLDERNAVTDCPLGHSDEHEMFLAKLLVGKSVKLDVDKTLVVPPKIGQGEQRYNTVTASHGKSTIYVVYENGRAYPSYLVRYYKGFRDTKRTPYVNKEEALVDKHLDFAVNDVPHKSTIQWEFKDDNGWAPYDDAHQKLIELAYARGDNNVIVITSKWKYTVCFQSMSQTNEDHVNKRKRDIRRFVCHT